jgi:NADPH:quinone reductase-like Zn-dependent oxidoreductase
MRGIVYSSKDVEGIKFCDSLKKPLTPIKDGYCLVKVKANSVNPVDAKYKVEDKLPHWIAESLGKWYMNKKLVGFDFSGIIEELGL